MLRIIVLGAGAGGGFPQWNCNCSNCQRARAGDKAARHLTQSSLAVSADDGISWYLLNASPDVRQQITQTSALHPRTGRRDSPIAGVVLSNADVDHVAGLLTLREAQPLVVYATSRVLAVLKTNAIFNVLNPDLVVRRAMPLDQPLEIRGPDGRSGGFSLTAFPVPGKVALWLEEPGLAHFGSVAEDTVGLEISGAGRRFFYLPGCAELPDGVTERLKGADLVFFDGTTWTDDEMIVLGLGTKTASRMGHISMAGAAGSIATFASLNVARKIFVHINNSNPVLIAGTPERAAAIAAGWEIGADGMEVRL
ncbi:MAG: pyrroloquinoline quinone biosynthesis protein PqqB [Azospirillaceae bacterium]|nr:pyrroloquinoline quinone biosynthesis protein PqqB [Azospirillaceae bacterium]